MQTKRSRLWDARDYTARTYVLRFCIVAIVCTEMCAAS